MTRSFRRAPWFMATCTAFRSAAPTGIVGWYGDMEMGRHAWNLLKSGPLDVRIMVGAAGRDRQFC